METLIIKEWASFNILTFSSSAAHLKQLQSIMCRTRDCMSVMSWLVVIVLCVGVISAVPNPILGMSTSPSLSHACLKQLYQCLMFSPFPSAPLNPLECTEHTIPEEYIVVFKQDACKTQGVCSYIRVHIKLIMFVVIIRIICSYIHSPGTHEITEWNTGSIRWSLLCQIHLWYGEWLPWILCLHGWDVRLLQYITLYLRLVFMYRTLERVRRMSEVHYVERNQVRLSENLFVISYGCMTILKNYIVVLLEDTFSWPRAWRASVCYLSYKSNTYIYCMFIPCLCACRRMHHIGEVDVERNQVRHTVR